MSHQEIWNGSNNLSSGASANTANNVAYGNTTVGNAIDVIKENIGDAFDTEKTYNVGDCCIKDNKLYVCTTAVEKAGEWSDENWELTNITTVISEKTSEINDSLTDKGKWELLYKTDSSTKATVTVKDLSQYREVALLLVYSNCIFGSNRISVELFKQFTEGMETRVYVGRDIFVLTEYKSDTSISILGAGNAWYAYFYGIK